MENIITASASEISSIQHIAQQTWPSTFKNILTLEQIHYMLNMMYNTATLQDQLQHQQFKIYQENEPLGFIGYEHNCKGSSKTKIHKIYILPSAQGKGVGKKLIHEAIQAAQINGDAALFLNVNRYNKAAIDFYQHLGFEVIQSEDIDIGNGFLMEDYVMEKSI
jgi:diamine N-acetyltransferase